MLWVIIAVLYIKSLESFLEVRKGKIIGASFKGAKAR
jgi:hypothetical protein